MHIAKVRYSKSIQRLIFTLVTLAALASTLLPAHPVFAATPTVVLPLYPANGATGVAVGVNPYVNFGVTMLPATINSTNVQLRKSSDNLPVTATVALADGAQRAIIIPSVALAPTTPYYLYVGTGVMSTESTALASAYGSASTSQFTTTGDTTPPTVISVTPTGAGQSIGVQPYVTFSEAMLATTINNTNVRLKDDSLVVTVTATVTLAEGNTRAVLTPVSALNPNSTYHIEVTTGVTDVAGNALAFVYNLGGIVTTFITDAIHPTVSSQYPLAGATGVAVGVQPYINFSEPMRATSINSQTVWLKKSSDNSVVAATVALAEGSNQRAIIIPSVALAPNTQYYLYVGGAMAVLDVDGNALSPFYGSGTTSQFTTGGPPTVVSAKVTDANKITVVYSEAVTSVFGDYTSLVLTAGGARAVTGASVTTNTVVLTFDGLPALTNETATMNIGATVKDTTTAQNALVAITAQSVTDGQKPTVNLVSPTVTGQIREIRPYVNFSEAMNPSTLNSDTVILKQGAFVIPAVVTLAQGNTRAVLTPATNNLNGYLDYNTVYHIVVTTGVTDVAGNAMLGTYTGADFTTLTADITHPEVSYQYPSPGATGVDVSVNPYVQFTEPIDPTSINHVGWKLKKSSDNSVVPASVVLSENLGDSRVLIIPSVALAPNTQYYVYLQAMPGVGPTDFAGLGLAVDYGSNSTSQFTTGPTTVAITSPAAGATVSGATQAIDFTTNGGVGVAANASVDGGSYSITGISNTGGHGRFTWDTTGLANGTHTVQIKDTVNSVDGYSAAVSYVVNNPVVVMITHPAASSVVSGTVAVNFTTNGGATTAAQISIDGSEYIPATSNGAPGVYSWDTTSVSNGNHTLQVKDTVNGVPATSAAITVTVNNVAVDITPPTVDSQYPSVGVTGVAVSVVPIIPTVTLNGSAIASTYTLTAANTRFASDLTFAVTNSISATVNGASSAISGGGNVTAAALASAITLGAHSYNVNVTSSTAHTASMLVTYQVNADAVTPVTPTITLLGDALNSAYSATEANTRFNAGADGDNNTIGLKYSVTGTTTATVNGASAAISGGILTVAAPADAITLGMHTYDIILTSSTGTNTTLNITYHVNADAVTPVIPTVSIYTGDAAIVSSYTATQANTRFTSGLRFTVGSADMATVNGASATITGTTVTAAVLADAVTLGAHSYNVIVTSSTGHTASILVTYQVTADAVTPVTISHIQILNITSTTATVTWTTNVASISNAVDYGLTYSLLSSQVTSTGDGVTSHSTSLTGLTTNSTYYFQILSTAGGQTTVAGIYSFVTQAADSGIAVSIQILKASANADDTYTNGWEFKFNITDYDSADTSLVMKFNDWVGWLGSGNTVAANGNMKIALTDDVAGVQAGTVGAAVGNNYTDETTVLTLVDHDLNVGGIQTTVYVYVKIPVGSSGGAYSTTYGLHTD